MAISPTLILGLSLPSYLEDDDCRKLRKRIFENSSSGGDESALTWDDDDQESQRQVLVAGCFRWTDVTKFADETPEDISQRSRRRLLLTEDDDDDDEKEEEEEASSIHSGSTRCRRRGNNNNRTAAVLHDMAEQLRPRPRRWSHGMAGQSRQQPRRTMMMRWRGGLEDREAPLRPPARRRRSSTTELGNRISLLASSPTDSRRSVIRLGGRPRAPPQVVGSK